ncbi:MAG TPA: flagellar brake domain-containing protein [Thermotogota bacterium]|nr:flagellar brake domain-containing protein [Thermotogota bacterium]HRW35119.1 flagellar brake domain-containing protein [Thermotogota bacterium]
MDYLSSKVSTESVLSIGKPLLLDVSDPELAGVYKSSIFELDFQKKVMTIGMPSFKGQFIPIPAGVTAYVKMFDQSSMYVFMAKVIGYEKNKEGFLITYVTLPDQARKIQRRQFVRIPFYQKGIFALEPFPPEPMIKDMEDLKDLKNEKKEKEIEVNFFITKDLSANGLQMVTKPRLTAGLNIFVNLEIGGGINLENQAAKIIRKDASVDTANNIYGVQFLSMSKSKEDKLVKYIFHLQQERRKKEKQLKEGS